MDFKYDLINITKKILDDNGIDHNKAGKEILYYYVDRMIRFIDSGVSYTIKYSDEFTNTIESLTKEQLSGVKEIEQRLRNKESITGFLSNTLFSPIHKDIDTLLKNWNIHHAHLSENRSSSLLFFIQEQETIYFIDVLEHPKCNDWFKRHLLKVLASNWPWLLREAPGVTKVIKPLNDKDVHRESSDKFILLELGDSVVMPTNFGVTSSGISNYAVMKVDSILEMLDEWQANFQNHATELTADIRKQISIELDKPLQLILIIEDNWFIAYDKNHQIKIPMFCEP